MFRARPARVSGNAGAALEALGRLVDKRGRFLPALDGTDSPGDELSDLGPARQVAVDLSYALACASGCFFLLAGCLRFGAMRSRIIDSSPLSLTEMMIFGSPNLVDRLGSRPHQRKAPIGASMAGAN